MTRLMPNCDSVLGGEVAPVGFAPWRDTSGLPILSSDVSFLLITALRVDANCQVAPKLRDESIKPIVVLGQRKGNPHHDKRFNRT